MALVIISDYEINRRIELFYSEDEFSIFTREFWEKTDKFLVDIQHIKIFSGFTRWCDLEPSHYCALIEQKIQGYIAMEQQDRIEENSTARSMNFMICGLMLCLKKKTEGNIDVMKISRLNATNVSFEFTGSINIDFKPKPSASLSVVVDNS